VRRRVVVAGMIAAALDGCSVLPSQPYLQRRDWPLAVGRPEALPRRPDGRVLLVRTMQAGPGMETRGLQTLQKDGSLQTAFYEQWSTPPAEAVDDDLRRWLADSGLFAAVLGTGSRVSADLVLESELVALHANLATGTARAAMAFVLIDQRSGAARIRMERTESASVKLDGIEPPALVRAQQASVAAVLGQIEADLAGALQA